MWNQGRNNSKIFISECNTCLMMIVIAIIAASCSPTPIPTDRCASYELPTASALTIDVEFDDTRFGGPYDYKAGPQKLVNFWVYQIKDLYCSHGVDLSQELLSDSIIWYKQQGDKGIFPFGNIYQRYNFVIDSNGRIMVAIWNQELLLNAIGNDPHMCQRGDLGFTISEFGTMINFYPEYPELPNVSDQLSPCWFSVPASEGLVQPGILDALSKHFMLAQPIPSIQEYNEDTWILTEVAYAGEILVDVQNCFFTINNNSGTYRPDGGDNLVEVAKYFEEQLLINPAFIQDWGNQVVKNDPSARIPELTWCDSNP